jgi:phage-related protein
LVHWRQALKNREKKVVPASFYRAPGSDPPSEPVRDWLQTLARTEVTEIGRDLKVVEYHWPRVQDVRPKLVKHFEGAIWYTRTNLESRIARVFFTILGGRMILLHGFIKKSQVISETDGRIAKDRLRKLKESR